MATSRDATYLVSDRVLSRALDGEAVLLDLASGNYFGLDEVGTLVWESLGEGGTVDAIVARMVGAYDVEAARAREDVMALLAELERRGLIVASPPR